MAWERPTATSGRDRLIDRLIRHILHIKEITLSFLTSPNMYDSDRISSVFRYKMMNMISNIPSLFNFLATLCRSVHYILSSKRTLLRNSITPRLVLREKRNTEYERVFQKCSFIASGVLPTGRQPVQGRPSLTHS